MGLYIHVPFCGSICSYCHFARTDRHDAGLRRRYVEGVLQELRLRRERCSLIGSATRPVATCYLGGGTPSTLEPELMADLLGGTLGALPRAADVEVTAEANPETLTPDLAAAWVDAGINRISLGVQSLSEPVLDLLGRACRPRAARAALALACRTFRRVSADWILGPGVDRQTLLAELGEAVDLGVEHVSLYLLELHPGTPLEGAVRTGRLAMPADPVLESLYLAAGAHLEGLGLRQYEVANFSRPGAESRHNGSYWRRSPYLGLGPGAHGFWGARRYANHRGLGAWLADLDEGRVPEAQVDRLDRADRRLEGAVLALRTREGVRVDRLPPGALDLERGAQEGLWRIAGGRLALTRRGYLRIDTIEERIARAM
ncbi:coproporphyrinogen III oxidase family protein [bacterium]|nr:coproporphyrinogen III oxidase family protein [bacterium]